YVFHAPAGNSDWSRVHLVARLKQRSDDGVADSTAIRAGNTFGTSVAISGPMIAVGALNSSAIDGQPANSQGKDSAFAGVNGQWNGLADIPWQTNLFESTTAPRTRFGGYNSALRLTFSGGLFRCFVPATYDDVDGVIDAGSNYVFQGSL